MSDNFSGPSGSNSVTEVTSTGWFSRVAQSFVGALFGLLLLVGAIVLIFWNESRAVDAIRGLKQGTAALVEASADHVDPAMDGRLVHITGLLAVGVPAEDPVLGLRHQGVARLKREVEMLQWVEHSESVSHTDVGGRKTTETTYSYSTDWQERPVDSTRFHVRDGHQNPQMSLQTAVFDSPSPSIGGRTVSPEVMPVLSFFTTLTPPQTAIGGYVRDGDQLFHGANPNQPAVGDLRVHFSAVSVGPISVLAGQRGAVLVASRSPDGYLIALAAPGDVPAAEMLRQKGEEERQLTWILRGAGFVAVLVGLLLVASPLSTLAGVIPLFGSIVGGGVFLLAFGLAVPITLLCVGIAWMSVRPLLGGGLVAAAVGSYVLLRLLRPAARQR